VSISEQNIEIRYFAPWQKNVSVNVADIVRVDYEKGYYDWLPVKGSSNIECPANIVTITLLYIRKTPKTRYCIST